MFCSNIWRGTLGRNFGVTIGRAECEVCNVEFGYQFCICSSTKENHEKSWSSWPIAGTSGCRLTSSQQSDIKYATITLAPIRLFLRLKKCTQLFYGVSICILLRRNEQFNIKCAKSVTAYTHIHTNKYIYLYIFLFVIEYSWNVNIFGGGDRVSYKVCCFSCSPFCAE
jgi:predicted ATPase